MIKKILDNFYLRNLTVLLILLSVQAGLHSARNEAITWDVVQHAVIFQTYAYMQFLFHNLVLYNKLFMRKRYVLYILSLFTMVFAVQKLHDWLMYKMTGNTIGDFGFKVWAGVYWINFMYIFLALGIYLAFKYSRERERMLQLENEKKELELKQLNEQLNPHFLFNALNNIYSYLLIGSNTGRELILKLSELMRYVLDSSKKDLVPVREEIQFIEHYIAFEKERLGTRCEIDYSKRDAGADLKIVPLVLFTFIENAFKHGTASIQKSIITIRLDVGEDSICLYVMNPASKNDSISTQIGLENTRRRMDLLYHKQYKLSIAHDKESYAVTLEIVLR